ncbi:MAG: hypothetical protein WEF99_12695 [Thermoanaerobaculia bacterium]
MRLRVWRLLASAVLLCVLPLPAQTPAGARGPIAITRVTVINTTGGPPRPDMTVEIEGDRITRVGPSGRAKVPRDAQLIDGTGKFLIPGLWDMHIHTFFGDWVPGSREVTLPLFIANGVTGVRDMGSDVDLILAARQDVARAAGPHPGGHRDLCQDALGPPQRS